MKKKTAKDYFRQVRTFDELWLACRELEDSEPGALPLVYIPKGLTPAEFWGHGVKRSTDAAERLVKAGMFTSISDVNRFVSYFGGGYLFNTKPTLI